MAIGGILLIRKRGLQLFVLAALAALAAAPAPADAAGSKGFKPGARTLGDPILPQLGNGGYEARHYDIELDFDPAANRFDSAVTTIRARATQHLSEFSLDFQDLAVQTVRVNGRTARFQQVEATPDLSETPTTASR